MKTITVQPLSVRLAGCCIRRVFVALVLLYAGLLVSGLHAQTTLYWNGGSGNWNTTGATNWATTSGGGGTLNWTNLANAEIVSSNPTLTITAATINATNFLVNNGATISGDAATRSLYINGTGSGDFTLSGGTASGVRVYLNGTSGYNGKITLASVGTPNLVMGSTTGAGTSTKVVLSNPRAAIYLDAPIAGNTATIGELSGSAGWVSVNFGTGTSPRTLNINQDTNSSFAGTFAKGNASRVLAVTKSGTGTLTLGSINTNEGATIVSGGVLRFDAADVAAVSTTGTRTSTSTVLTSVASTAGLVVGQQLSASGFTDGAVILDIGVSTVTLSVAASSSGGTTLNFLKTTGISANSNLVLGGGVVGLGAVNFTRSLGTTANQVQWTGDGGFAAYTADRTVNLGGVSAPVTWGSGSFVGAGATLILGAADATHTLDFQNGIALDGAARTVKVDNGSAAADAKLSGVISGTGSSGLAKTGAGTLVLSGTNSYQGTTLVSAGTLIIDGDQSTATGNVNVEASAILGGSGTIGGALNISGTLAPGSSAAQLTVNNNVAFANSSAFAVEINGATVGTQYDQLRIGASGGPFNTTLGSNVTLTLSLGFAPTTGQIFTLVDNQTAGTWAGGFANLTPGGNISAMFSGTTYQFQANNFGAGGINDLVLTVVPEPATSLLLAVAGTLLIVTRRRARLSRCLGR